jgi:hypothetical protein
VTLASWAMAMAMARTILVWKEANRRFGTRVRVRLCVPLANEGTPWLAVELRYVDGWGAGHTPGSSVTSNYSNAGSPLAV